MNCIKPVVVVVLGLLLTACEKKLPYEPDADSNGHTAPTAATVAANAAVLEALDFSNEQDFEDANRGLIASDPDLQVYSPGEALV
jgi:alkyl sulfatase BDS1-like metallo-beta-lactamase superfamily hydrolase